MFTDKKLLYLIFLAKYIIILTFNPDLESERFFQFFDSCRQICINPYENIDALESGSLSFPYGYIMYLFLLPFFYISKFAGVSFTILAYIFVEIYCMKLMKEFFDIETKKLIFPVVLNPLVIYSVVIKGYLDFIPFFFFMLCLYHFKNKHYTKAIIFLSVGIGTKIVLAIILPLLLLYIYKNSSNKNTIKNLVIYSFAIISLIYLPVLNSSKYYDSVLRGITEGALVLQSTGVFSLDTLVISQIIIFITYYFFWKNVKKMDYFGLVICLGICTYPLFVLNFSNLGWFMWTLPAIVYIFISMESSRKFLLFIYFSSIIFVDLKFFDLYKEYLTAAQFLISLIVIKYFYQFLTQNKYYRVKSKPILLAIAGDSGVGKSTISEILYSFFGKHNTTKIEIDNYHKYERDSAVWNIKTHLDPTLNNLSLYKKQLTEIISGNEEKIREYNHLTGKFDEGKNIKVNDFMIIEGLHTLLMEDLNGFYNIKIYLDTEKSIKDKFKIERDLARNKTLESIEQQIKDRKNDFEKFIKPQQNQSDLYIETVKIEGGNISLKLFFDIEYLEELIDIFESNQLAIGHLDYDDKNANLTITSSVNNIKLCHELTRNFINVQDDLFLFEENEFHIKASLIIFFLSKKLELI